MNPPASGGMNRVPRVDFRKPRRFEKRVEKRKDRVLIFPVQRVHPKSVKNQKTGNSAQNETPDPCERAGAAFKTERDAKPRGQTIQGGGQFQSGGGSQ